MKKFYIAFFFFIPFFINAQVSESEFQALKALYNATKGDNWTDNTGWNTINTTATKESVNETWEGLRIVDGHIRRINLSENNLDGMLPKEIGRLKFVTNLYMGGNKLRGTIPDSIGQMTNLYQIQMYRNQLSGSLPATLARLPKIGDINFSGNQLTGALPLAYDSISTLEVLALEDNNLEGNLPKLTQSTSILNLYLRNNNFSGELPIEWFSFDQLLRLYLNDNNLTGSIEGRVNFTKLKGITISNNYFTFEGIEAVYNELLPFLGTYNTLNQKTIPVNQNQLSFDAGNPLALNAQTLTSTNLGGANNRYRWTRNDEDVYSGNNPEYSVPEAGVDHAGIYKCYVTNTQVPDLELELDRITVNIVGGNSIPSDIRLSHDTISEGLYNTKVGIFTATDADESDVHVFTLANGNGTNDLNNNNFEIKNNNELFIKTGANYEIHNQLKLFVKADDQNGGIFTKAFIVTINDVNEAPVLYNATTTLDENAAVGTTVFTLEATDPENDNVSYSITGGNNSGAFGISGNSLIVEVANKLDYETATSDTVYISASDGTLSDEAQFIVKLNQIDEPPIVDDFTFNVDENSSANTLIGIISATDPESKTLSFQITSGNSEGYFKLENNQLKVAKPINYEEYSSFNLVITVNDGVSNIESNVTVNINNLADETGNDILSFTFDGIIGSADINPPNKTIYARISGNKLLENIVVNFTLSAGASCNISTGTNLNFGTTQTLEVTSETGSKANWKVTIEFPESASNIIASQWKIYPQPAQDILCIESTKTITEIEFYTFAGQHIETIKNPLQNINISHLNSGIYWVRLVIEDQFVSQRLIKQ